MNAHRSSDSSDSKGGNGSLLSLDLRSWIWTGIDALKLLSCVPGLTPKDALTRARSFHLEDKDEEPSP